jgi:hypothetical protein
VFTVRFDRLPADVPPGDPTAALPRPAAGRLLGLRALVAEDHEFNQQVMAELLEAEGADVTMVSSGIEVLEHLAEGPLPDVLLMDVQMPGMDGIETTRLLRQNPAYSDLLVIALTADVLAEQRVACLSAGMNDFEPKPLDLDHLCGTMARWLPDLVAGDIPAPAPGPSRGRHVDASVLARFFNNDSVKVARFGQRFVETGRDTVERMRQAVAADDRPAVARLTHSFRPAAATVGALRLADMVEELERRAGIGEPLDAAFQAAAIEFGYVAQVLSLEPMRR